MYFNKRKFCIALGLTLSANIALADDQINSTNTFSQFISEKILSSLVVSLSAGPVWESAGQTQTFFLQPEVEKTYSANNTTHALAEGELFVGVQHTINNKFQGQLGLEVATTGNADLSGDIWDDADPTFNNYTYSYQVNNTRIAIKGKLLTDIELYALKPYLSASLGVGFNRAHNFNNSPTIFQAVASPNFTSNTTTAFSYTAGLGVQKALNTHWQIGVGYEFADWGKSELSSAEGQTMNSGLSLNHLYTNGVLLNLTYVA